MFAKTKDGKVTNKSKKQQAEWQEYIEYFSAAKGRMPPRLIVTSEQLANAFDKDFSGPFVFMGLPLVLVQDVRRESS